MLLEHRRKWEDEKKRPIREGDCGYVRKLEKVQRQERIYVCVGFKVLMTMTSSIFEHIKRRSHEE